MIEPYPNDRLLGLVEGEHTGQAPTPPFSPEFFRRVLKGTTRTQQDAVKGLPRIPTAEEAGDMARRQAERYLQPERTPGAPPPGPACLIPGLFGGCLISQDTATLIGVNILLLVALVIGGLMLLQGPITRGMRAATDVAL